MRVSLREQRRTLTLAALLHAGAPVSVLATSLSPGAIAAAVIGAAVVIALLVILMRRYEDAFPLLAILALPFRLPISAEGRTVNLLIPLYLVVAAGVLAHLLPRLLRREERAPGKLEWVLLASLVLYALQTIYSTDRGKAAENLAFFYIPFALLLVLLRDVRWRRELLLRCLAVAVALAVVFAGIGFVEYARKELFLNPKVVASNQFDNYFRVNSLFFDPNIYGRFLALVMIAVTTFVLWRRNVREVWLAAAVLLWLLAGLVTSFSQSSIAALLLGLAVLAAYRWSVRWTLVPSAGASSCSRLLVALARAVGLALRAEGHRWLGEQRDDRARKADRRRPRTVRETTAAGLRLGLVPDRVRTPLEDDRRERDVGIAHDPDHGRRRAGHRRICAVHRAARARLPRAVPRRRALAAAHRDRCVLRGARAAHVRVRRLPRGSADVDTARDRPCIGPRRGDRRTVARRHGPAGRRARRRRVGATAPSRF